MSETIFFTGGTDFIGNDLVHHWQHIHPQDRFVVPDKLTNAADRSQFLGLVGVQLTGSLSGHGPELENLPVGPSWT